MRKIILHVFLILSAFSDAQTRFDRQLNIPVTENGATLRFPWAGGINFPLISPIDLNGDGRTDIFLYDHHNKRILTFVNNGNLSADQAWDYAPEYASQFPPVNKFAYL